MQSNYYQILRFPFIISYNLQYLRIPSVFSYSELYCNSILYCNISSFCYKNHLNYNKKCYHTSNIQSQNTFNNVSVPETFVTNYSLSHKLNAHDHYKNNHSESNQSSRELNIENVLESIRSFKTREIDHHLFEWIDENLLVNLDKFSVVDLSILLQLTLKNYYSQNVIEALVEKLKSTEPTSIQISTLSTLIQNLGRMQSGDFEWDQLNVFFDKCCKYFLKYPHISESIFSSIIYGFQRLHYYNEEFLINITKRYHNDLTNYNINSLIISLSSLIKLNYYNYDMITNIYKYIIKSLSNMSLQTSIQLLGTISKIHEYYNGSNNDFDNINSNSRNNKNLTVDQILKLNKLNYRFINYILRNLCNSCLNRLNVVQLSLILNSLNKVNFRKTSYIGKLIQAIPCMNNETYNKYNNTNNMNYTTNVDQFNNNTERFNQNIDVSDNDIIEDIDGIDHTEILLSSIVDSLTVVDNTQEIKDNKSKEKEKNIFSYMNLPQCPFNYDLTYKKLKGVEPNHLILICDSIFGLEYYTDYSLNLMFLIKDIINPILHELKGTNILIYLLPFSNIHFTDYQVERLNIFNKKSKNTVSIDQLKLILKSLEINDNYNNNWFEEEHLLGNLSRNNYRFDEEANRLLQRLKNRLMRCEWKEDLVLSSYENLLRHVNYIKITQNPLNRFKFLYSLLINDIYVNNCPIYYKHYRNNPQDNNKHNSISIGVDEHSEKDINLSNDYSLTNEEPVYMLPAIIPENIIEVLDDVYMTDIDNDNNNNLTNAKDNINNNNTDDKDNNNIVKQNKQNENSDNMILFNNYTLHIDKPILCFNVPIVITNN